MKIEDNVDNIRLKTMSKRYLSASEYPNNIIEHRGILMRTFDSHTKGSFIISVIAYIVGHGVLPKDYTMRHR